VAIDSGQHSALQRSKIRGFVRLKKTANPVGIKYHIVIG